MENKKQNKVANLVFYKIFLKIMTKVTVLGTCQKKSVGNIHATP